MKIRRSLVLRWFAALAVIAAVVYSVALVWATTVLRRARAEVVAAGRPVLASQIIPPEVPDWENAAPLYESAWRQLEAAPEGDDGLLAALAERARSVASDKASAETRAEFAALLARPETAAALELVRRAAERPACRFAVKWNEGAGMLLPHVGPIAGLAHILAAQGRLQAEAGETDAAWATVRTLLRLSGALRKEPTLISQLVRVSQAGMAMDLIARLTVDSRPGPEAAAEIDALLAALDDCAPFVAALDGERLLLGEGAFDQDLRRLTQVTVDLSGSRESWYARPLRWLIAPLAWLRYPTPVRRFDHAVYLRIMSGWAQAASRPYYEAGSGDREPEVPGSAILTRMLLPALGSVRRRFDQFLARVRVTRTALALERHRAARGAYPAALADLDPELSAEALGDPFVAGPLTYRRTETGFTLYSVGPDGKDNGGAPKPARNTTTSEWDIPWSAQAAAGVE